MLKDFKNRLKAAQRAVAVQHDLVTPLLRGQDVGTVIQQNPERLNELLQLMLMMSHAQSTLSNGDLVIFSKLDMQISTMQDMWEQACGSGVVLDELGSDVADVFEGELVADDSDFSAMIHHCASSVFRVLDVSPAKRVHNEAACVQDHIVVTTYHVVAKLPGERTMYVQQAKDDASLTACGLTVGEEIWIQKR